MIYTEQNVREIIDSIKTGNKRLVSNCYERATEYCNNVIRHYCSDDAVAFIYDDHGVNRIYFYAKRIEDFIDLSDIFDSGEYVIEIPTRNPENIRVTFNNTFPTDETI